MNIEAWARDIAARNIISIEARRVAVALAQSVLEAQTRPSNEELTRRAGLDIRAVQFGLIDLDHLGIIRMSFPAGGGRVIEPAAPRLEVAA